MLATVMGCVSQPYPAEDRTLANAVEVGAVRIRVEELEAHYDNLVLFDDLRDKVASIGAPAAPVLKMAIAKADNSNPQRTIFLTALLAILDDLAMDALIAAAVGEVDSPDSPAIKLLGRVGAIKTKAREEIQRLTLESTNPLRERDIVHAAIDAGCLGCVAHFIERLEDGRNNLLYHAIGTLARNMPKSEVLAMIESGGALGDAGAFAARWSVDSKIESALIERLDKVQGWSWIWTVESLGAVGGKKALEALRRDYLASPREEVTGPRERRNGMWYRRGTDNPSIDVREWALARLGDADSLDLIRFAMSSERFCHYGLNKQIWAHKLSEQFGAWAMPGAEETLQLMTNGLGRSSSERQGAARGLCWLKKLEGLYALARLLNQDHPKTDLEWDRSLVRAQDTLHSFVGNANRPDYEIFDGTEGAYRKVGMAWTEWIRRNEQAIQWRRPSHDGLVVLWW